MTDFLNNEPLGGVAPRPIPQTVEDPTIAHLKAQLAAMQQEQPVREIPQPAPPAPQVDPAVQQMMAELAALKAQNQQVQTLPALEAATTLKPKKNWLLIGSGCALLLFFILPMLLGISYVLVNQFWSDDGGDGKPAVVDVDTDPVSFDNPAEAYVVNWGRGMSELSADVAAKIRSEELVGTAAVKGYWTPRKNRITERSFGPLGKAIDKYNGEDWNQEEAAVMYDTFSEGFSR